MGRLAICPEDERLSIWYARPAPHLARYLTAYDAYYARLRQDEFAEDVIPPAWAAIRFSMTPGLEPSVRMPRRGFETLPRDALFGPSSHAVVTRFNGGEMLCVGLTPLGWARFMRRDASGHANRIVPLDAMWDGRAAELRSAVTGAADPAAAFDAFFTDLLERTEPEDPAIGELLPPLLDPAVSSIAELAKRAGLPQRMMARLSARHLGFPPKLLLRRARFMRALVELLRTERGGWAPLVIRAGYHDQSHFVRDCQLFLGMTMSEFMRRPKPLFEASVRLRAAVVGTPAQALHPVDE